MQEEQAQLEAELQQRQLAVVHAASQYQPVTANLDKVRKNLESVLGHHETGCLQQHEEGAPCHLLLTLAGTQLQYSSTTGEMSCGRRELCVEAGWLTNH